MKKLTFLTAILLAFSTLAQVPNYVPTNGLVGWWPFNGNANDESGNGNNGTVNGATLTNDRNGVANNAYSFDGVNDNISAGNYNLTVDYTLSFWCYLNTSNFQYPIGLGINNNNTVDLYKGYGIGFSSLNPPCSSMGTLRYFTYDAVSTCNSWLEMTNQTTNNVWINIIVTHQNSEVKMYLNGVLNVSGSNLNLQGILSLYFGSRSDNFAFLNGSLDDIGIWNRALTDCEIKDLYNSQLGSSNTTSSQTQTALDTYTWPVNNQTYTQSGTYSDTLVNAAGCDSIVTLNLTLNYTGINELNASQLVVSPNPTKDNFSISGLELLGTITSLEIKDAAGKVVKVLNPTTTNFSCVGLKAGVYFLVITSNKKERVIKIIKE